MTSSKLGRGIAIASALIAGVLLAFWLALPSLVRLGVQREASARGVRLELGAVSVGLSGIELRDVRFEREDGLRGVANHVGVNASLIDLVKDRLAGVREISIEGAELELLLPARSAARDADGVGGGARSRALPPIRASRVGVRVVDARGELARARVDMMRVAGDRAELEIATIAVGGSAAPLATASKIRLDAETTKRRLSRVEIGAVDLSGLSEEERAARFFERLRALRDEAEPSSDDPVEDEASFSKYSRLLDRLSDEFELRVARTVLPHGSEREAFVLEDFGLERNDTSKVRIYGGGRGPSSARAIFDVGFDALALRANGKIEVENLALDAIAGLVPRVPWHEPEHGTLDVDVRFEATSPDVIGFQGTLVVSGLGIDSPRIASEPIVGLDFSLSAAGSWDVEGRRLEVERGTFGLGKAKVDFEGASVLDLEAWSLSLRARLPRTGCDEAVHAFPSAILGGASEFQLRGTLAGELALRIDGQAPQDLELDIRVDDQCRFVDWPAHADPGRFRSLFVHEALDPSREPFDFETGPRSEVWTNLEDVSPYLIAALLAHEDASFFRHKGFSTFAIKGSLARNIVAGRFERGASTLTMQLAKNLFLNREKVLVRKLREVIYTWWLEKGFGKEATLELYLNVVEFGPYIYGIRNASLHYFGREPSALSPAEATFLATILPAPRTGAYHYERGELSRASKNRVASLLKNMEKRDLLSKEAAEYGLSEVESFRFHPEGAPLPPPRTLPPTHPLFEMEPSTGRNESMGEADFDPWGFP
jgi:hypothetical protein